MNEQDFARIIYLVRHGETEWNRERRMQGQGNSALTNLGRQQADEHGRFLARVSVEKVFASPLGRVRETLERVEAYLDVEPVFDERLQEWHCGDWSGHLYADLAGRWPDDHDRWVADRVGVRPPGGENYEDLMARARSFIAARRTEFAPRTAIVAHGLLNRALAAVMLDLPPTELLDIRQRNNTILVLGETASGEVEAWHHIGTRGPFGGLPRDRVGAGHRSRSRPIA